MSNIAQPKVRDRVRIVVEGTVTELLSTKTHGQAVAVEGYEYYPEWAGSSIVSLEILEPPKPEWVQGDVVIVEPEKPYSFVLLRQEADRWVCSKEADGKAPHDHTDYTVNNRLDNGRATVLIAGGRVVTPE